MANRWLRAAFPVKNVFQILYKALCTQISAEFLPKLGASDDILPPSAFNSMLEDEMEHQFRQCRELQLTSCSNQKTQLIKHRQDWEAFKPRDICLTCFSCTSPEFQLPCQHAICLSCVQAFGTHNNYRVSLHRCILCGSDSEGFEVQLKPKTAATRVLSIDGGGTRARVALTFLREIEKAVNLPIPVQDNFDVICGTSSGTSHFAILSSADRDRCNQRVRTSPQ